MSTIIAGQFPTITGAEEAIARLRAAGVHDDDMCSFRVNPAAEHDQYPLGGDHDESVGAKKADKGAIVGAAVGGAVGLAAGAAGAAVIGPMALPLGAGVGAYTGSLVGSLTEMETPPEGLVRPAGDLVAVNASSSDVALETIARVLEESGAEPVERAEGTWADGEWADFDPVQPPQRITAASSTASGPPSR